MSSSPSWIYDQERRSYYWMHPQLGRVYQNDPRNSQRPDDPRFVSSQHAGGGSRGHRSAQSRPSSGNYLATSPEQQQQSLMGFQALQQHQQQPAFQRQIYSQQSFQQASNQNPYQQPAYQQYANYQQQALSQQPSGSGPAPQTRPRAGPSRVLNPDYRRRKAKFFKQGKVFQILWTEGTNEETESVRSGPSWTKNSYNEWLYTKPRRFIVVHSEEAHCLAVPITTNNQQGAAKPRERKSAYGIVYSGRSVPQPTRDELPSHSREAPMQQSAIRVDMEGSEKLDVLSRINYAKPQSIDYYHKVRVVGVVNKESMAALLYQFRNVIGMGTGDADKVLRWDRDRGNSPDHGHELLARRQTSPQAQAGQSEGHGARSELRPQDIDDREDGDEEMEDESEDEDGDDGSEDRQYSIAYSRSHQFGRPSPGQYHQR